MRFYKKGGCNRWLEFTGVIDGWSLPASIRSPVYKSMSRQ